MLEKLKLLNAGTIRALLVATIPLLVLIASLFGLDEAVVGAKLEEWGEKVIALVTLAAIAWAAWERAFKPTPPLTEKAVVATQLRLEAEAALKAPTTHLTPPSQGGYASPAALSLLSLLALTVGCAALGTPTPTTFNERSAAAYASIATVREAAAVWAEGQAHTIDAADVTEEVKAERRKALAADARNVQELADRAREAVDVARSLRDINLRDADARLASAITIIQALQKYLEERR